jgi:hypothetical protein
MKAQRVPTADLRLDGEFYTSLFIHYMPSEGRDWTYERLATVAQARGLLSE